VIPSSGQEKLLVWWSPYKMYSNSFDIADKQAPCLQNHPEAYLDLWHSTVGICAKLSFGNSGEIPIESASDTNGMCQMR
jgi:hypothetical protein